MSDAEKPRSRSGLLFLVGLVAGALAVFLLLRTAPAPPPQEANTGDEQPVAVMLTVDDSGTPTAISGVSPDPVSLSRKAKQTAHWFLSPQADATIDIKMSGADTKPFKRNPKSYGKHALSETPDLGDYNVDYKYTITVTLKNGTVLKPLDPVIRVVP